MRQSKQEAPWRFDRTPALRSSLYRALMQCIAALACGLSVWCATAQVRYYYDELGRLVEVVAPDGASAQYVYDDAGNITAVRRNTASALSISEFTPNGGPVGTAVTLYGSGFTTPASSNTVKFNGTSATVASASATALTVTVPSGAASGPISVGNVNGTVTSAASFVATASKVAPTITSFSPQLGKSGDIVAVTGSSFDLESAANKVAFGSVFTLPSNEPGNPTLTQLRAAVPSAMASGKISIATQYGKAISTSDFYALPATVGTSDVIFKGRLVVDDGTYTSFNADTSGKKQSFYLTVLAAKLYNLSPQPALLSRTLVPMFTGLMALL